MAIANVTVADTLRASARPDQTVVIAGERIVASGNSEEVDLPIGVEVVDASGRYLIPGLIDMHVHAFWHPSVPASFLPLFVANGLRPFATWVEISNCFTRQGEGSPATPCRARACSQPGRFSMTRNRYIRM